LDADLSTGSAPPGFVVAIDFLIEFFPFLIDSRGGLFIVLDFFDECWPGLFITLDFLNEYFHILKEFYGFFNGF